MAGKADGKIIIDTKIDQSGFNKDAATLKSGLQSVVSSLRAVAGAVGVAFGIGAIVNFGKETVRVASELSDAMKGLQSIVEGQGRSFGEAQKFVQDYTRDGLIPLTNAVTAYKNLASRGYNDEQIKQTMTALKDAAAFGRQASYSLGDAVTSATEGLKNENSILVDNAGVTKNVSKMWDDYAKSIGTSAVKLTQQQKIQAEVNGILEETRFQTGDAAKAANSYSGQLAQLSASMTGLKTAVGNAIIPLAKGIIPVINNIIQWLTRLAHMASYVMQSLFGWSSAEDKAAAANNNLASSASAAADAETELAKATEAKTKAQKKAGQLAAGIDQINTLSKNNSSTASGSEIPSSPDASLSVPSVDFDSVLDEFDMLDGEVKKKLDKLSQAVKDKISNIKSTMSRIAEPWKSISFENLIKAFDGVKKAASPLIDTIGRGLKWLNEKVLAPLAKWFVEDFAPAGIDLLSGALEALNSVLEYLEPKVEWIWDNFLEPMLSWTGGVIVSTINMLANALKGIGKWIKENQGIVDVFLVAIGTLVGVWETAKLLSWLDTMGGLGEVILQAVNKILLLTSAKIADTTATVKNTFANAVSYVKGIATQIASIVASIVKWIAQTAAKVADTVATTAQTVATGIATAATWAFNLALTVLTSPITLIIIAVAALVAGIILLVKNWDKVKEVAANVWAKIKEVWSGVATWFKDKVTDPVIAKFNDMKDKVSSVWGKIKDAAKNPINGLLSIVENFINKFIGGINAIIDALNKISVDIPEGVPFVGGTKFGIDIKTLPEVKIPRLATGAVIPPRAEFAAILGDQKNGRNLEAPEGLIRKIVREETQGGYDDKPQIIELRLEDGSLFKRWEIRQARKRRLQNT